MQFLKSFFQKSTTGGALAGRRILVVEDEYAQRLMLKRILEKQGAQIFLAENGNEGLRKAAEHFPDLILLDERMPIMTGVEMCKKLKECEATRNIPIIFLTAADSPDDIVEHFEFGAEIHLSKPINAKELISQIQISFNNQKE
ncbi:MAG: response regulator [Candidatus Omnitrophota bacterium]